MITRPATPPAKGQETAQWVLDTITALPERHDQADWEITRHGSGVPSGEPCDERCDTTRCVGGWALWAHGYSAPKLTANRTIAVMAAKLLGLDTTRFPYGDDVEVETEICDYDAEVLFHDTDNGQAVEALRYLARGERIDWQEVMGQ